MARTHTGTHTHTHTHAFVFSGHLLSLFIILVFLYIRLMLKFTFREILEVSDMITFNPRWCSNSRPFFSQGILIKHTSYSINWTRDSHPNADSPNQTQTHPLLYSSSLSSSYLLSSFFKLKVIILSFIHF